MAKSLPLNSRSKTTALKQPRELFSYARDIDGNMFMMILKIHYHIIICLIQPLILGLIYKVDTLNSKNP